MLRPNFTEQATMAASELEPAPLVRSVFFYNSYPMIGSHFGLHFFEPRYRLLVQRLLHEDNREKSFVFLPNFVDCARCQP